MPLMHQLKLSEDVGSESVVGVVPVEVLAVRAAFCFFFDVAVFVHPLFTRHALCPPMVKDSFTTIRLNYSVKLFHCQYLW